MADQPSSSEAAEPQKRKRGRPKGRLNDVTLKLIELGVLPAPGAPKGPPKPRGRPRKNPQLGVAWGHDLGPTPASVAATGPGPFAATAGVAAGPTTNGAGPARKVTGASNEEPAATSSGTTLSQRHEIAPPLNGTTTQAATARVSVQPRSGQERLQQQQQPQLSGPQGGEPLRKKRGRAPKSKPAGEPVEQSSLPAASGEEALSTLHAAVVEQADGAGESESAEREVGRLPKRKRGRPPKAQGLVGAAAGQPVLQEASNGAQLEPPSEHEQPEQQEPQEHPLADSVQPVKKKRGRPAKLKPPGAGTPRAAAGENIAGPGHPAKRGRGRPKGSKNKPKGLQPLAAAAAAGPAPPPKRGRGRPKGSKNKPKGWQMLTAAVQQQLQQEAA